MTDNLNLGVLGPYLEDHVAGFRGLQRAEKFSGGQSNPTFRLYAQSGEYVLRRQPAGKLLKSAHAVDREFRVIKALSATDVPVAKSYHLCCDREVMGCYFYVMSYEPGRIFWDPALPECGKAERYAIYDEMSGILASLHNIDVDSVGLGDFGRPGNYFARQISRWTKQYNLAETDTIRSMDRLIAWLPENVPEDDGQVSLVHGDFRLDNIIFHSSEPTARALLDWELSTVGHPYADLAYQCMQLRIDADAIVPGLGGIDRQQLGIPTEAEYIETYCERRGLPGIPHWDFYLAFSYFRLAAILQGVLKRAIDGNASSKQATEYGSLTPVLAAMAIELINE